jgi:starch synthase
LNVLVATSECDPFAKAGVLADFCAALSVETAGLGHHVSVILPAYRQVHLCGHPIEPLGLDFIVPIGGKTVTGHLLRSSLADGQVPVYLVQQDQYFDREGLYGGDDADFVDNCERFVFFCRAIVEAIRLLELDVNVLHVNDWQTGLAAAYLKIAYARLPRYEQIACLMTLHNLASQGVFWHWDMLLTGLDWKFFNWHQMEFHNQLNLLKTGIVFADSISTVSPRYAQEIQSQPHGCGLDGLLAHRREVLCGIVNGIDYRVWDPSRDRHLAAKYDAHDWRAGKAVGKATLQRELGLPEQPDVPLISFVGELSDQMGIELIFGILPHWAENRDVQWVLLGKGDSPYERKALELAGKYPDRVAARIEFGESLAHRVEAGSDISLLPHQFNPCGRRQLQSLRYGAVPVVRATGGLADTVIDATEDTLAAGTATGFHFRAYSEMVMEEALNRACSTFLSHRNVWDHIVVRGMREDWSWSRTARQYADLYKKTGARHKQASLG